MFALLPKRKNCQLLKIIFVLLSFIVIYNIVLSSYIRYKSSDFKQTFQQQSSIDVLSEIERKNGNSNLEKFDGSKVNLRAGNLLIRPGLKHQHQLIHFNDTLFSRQGQFQLPRDQEYLGGKIKFGLFPESNNDDRIWSQMRYVPDKLASKKPVKKKIIVLFNGDSGIDSNQALYGCPVTACKITGDRELAKSADVILWMHNIVLPFHRRPPNQIWAFYFLESPYHTPAFVDFDRKDASYKMNWSATYRHDSTIVTPYFKYTPFNLVDPIPDRYPLPEKNYAQGKTKMAAWFVSNCDSRNDRMGVAHSLQKYIKVDIYGGCSKLACPRDNSEKCFEMLNKDYKFYLAFENSNCKDYITEKFFLNGLSHDVIPIVMGAHPEEYKRVAPPHSFIHIEHFPTIKQLAIYLIYLNSNDTAYNEYFSWKKHGLVDTNTFFWCRFCMMAHAAENHTSVIPSATNWWLGNSNNKIRSNLTADTRVCIENKRWT